MGLTAGAVATRVDPPGRHGLLGLVEHAQRQGLLGRWACWLLGLDHARMLSWKARAARRDLADAAPGPLPREAMHALLDWERAAVIDIAKSWGRWTCRTANWPSAAPCLGRVFVAESTVLRVPTAAGMHLPAPPPPIPATHPVAGLRHPPNTTDEEMPSAKHVATASPPLERPALPLAATCGTISRN